MNKFKGQVIETFNSYKCKEEFDVIKIIPVFDNDKIVGLLKPVTYLYKQISPEYIHLFSKWRKENPIAFASIFEISDQRTEFWVDHLLLEREDRILFVIHSLTGEPLGHLGLSSFNYEEKSCEIDNVVRGIKTDFKGIMALAMKSLIRWGISNLKLGSICLRVLADNEHAISFYERNNFIKKFDIPLYKIIQNDETKWIENKSTEDQMPDRYFTYMKLKE